MTRVRLRRSKDRRRILDGLDRWQIRYGQPANHELAALYLETRDQLFAEAEAGAVPIGFWAYEPSVPDELRVGPCQPAAYSYLTDHPESKSERYLRELAEWEAFGAKRADFLADWSDA